MIPKECKRLAEVDFPVAVVSRHAAREKSIRHGHPSTLHLWWARRPLASCRAMLLGLLLPDPCDPQCPPEFKVRAAGVLMEALGQNHPRLNEQITSDKGLRQALLEFIGEAANWDVADNADYISVAQELVRAAYMGETPLVVDPFAGGGSIPLEALRLGCEAFASDLNPVACLILKVMLEDIPRHGPALAEELRRVGGEIKKKAEKELAEFYPKDPDGATPIAYLWARTVSCESPNCGAEIPLVRSFWLCKKERRKRALRYRVVREPSPSGRGQGEGEGSVLQVVFEIFEPKTEQEVPAGTVTRAKATCLCCGTVLPPERVRTQLSAQRGGADVIFEPSPSERGQGEGDREDAGSSGRGQGEGIGRRIGGARLLAAVTLRPGEQGRHYRLPAERDYEVVRKAQKRLKEILEEWERGGRQGLCPVPDEPLPLMSGTFNVPLYGMNTWGDLFTARQKVALVTLVRLVRKHHCKERGAAVKTIALSLGKTLRHCNVLSKWHRGSETVAGAFGMQALPMSWDFPEMFPLVDYAGGLNDAQRDIIAATEAVSGIIRHCAQLQPADAAEHPLPDETAHIWFTDPPYYFAVPYADLSDFFFVSLKRALPGYALLCDPFDAQNALTPKERELCEMAHWDPRRYAHKDQAYFEEGMRKAFTEGRRVLREDGIGSVVFAHKTTEGWEALLSGIIKGGWTITGSWPIATERGARLRARESAALATSVHLVCRPRPLTPNPSPDGRGEGEGGVGDWGAVLRELPKRAGDWMERLRGEGVRGADLVFACIGPALEIFSRYSKVETAEGREVGLPEYLEKVWEVVGRTALEQVLGTAEAKARNGAAGELEEDARLTALFLWTLQSTNGNGPHPGPLPEGEGEDIEAGGDLSAEASAYVDVDEEESTPKSKTKGFSLLFDVVRRFAQPLGIELPKWEGRIIETRKGVVRLMPVSERARQLFGGDGVVAADYWFEPDECENIQMTLFPEFEGSSAGSQSVKRVGRGRRNPHPNPLPAGEGVVTREATTLDRVHAAMLLQAGGQTGVLREQIALEQERGPDFLRLANALSALYPRDSEEKRLLDAMLLAVPR
jgi:adenine-specific DNA methylase